MFFFLGAGLDAEPVLASLKIDLVVGRDFLVLVGDQVLGSEILIFFLLVGLRCLKRLRLLRLQHGFGHERRAARNARDGLVLAKIVKAGRTFGASALVTPFGLDHLATSPVFSGRPEGPGQSAGALP
jgi:hypothetical protein